MERLFFKISNAQRMKKKMMKGESPSSIQVRESERLQIFQGLPSLLFLPLCYLSLSRSFSLPSLSSVRVGKKGGRWEEGSKERGRRNVLEYPAIKILTHSRSHGKKPSFSLQIRKKERKHLFLLERGKKLSCFLCLRRRKMKFERRKKEVGAKCFMSFERRRREEGRKEGGRRRCLFEGKTLCCRLKEEKEDEDEEQQQQQRTDGRTDGRWRQKIAGFFFAFLFVAKNFSPSPSSFLSLESSSSFSTFRCSALFTFLELLFSLPNREINYSPPKRRRGNNSTRLAAPPSYSPTSPSLLFHRPTKKSPMLGQENGGRSQKEGTKREGF